jgi:rieske iron-sulfur protein
MSSQNLPNQPKACGCVSALPAAPAFTALSAPPGARPDSGLRRKVIKIAVAGMAAPWLLTGELAHAAITPGDRLVDDDAEGAPVPLKGADLRVGKPVVAYPFDAKQGIVRNESRLNRIVLLRLPEGELDATTKARSAGGVIAYSAICTHQACDAKTWLAKEKALVCFCHSSKFLVLENGAVANGPLAAQHRVGAAR